MRLKIVFLTLASVTFLISSCGQKEVKLDETTPAAAQATPPPSVVEAAPVDEQNDFETVRFDFDSAKLGKTAKEVLKKNLAWLKEKSHVKMTIKAEGHCDERGSDDYNLQLGKKRADAVKQYLTSHGIKAKRITVESFGKDHPQDPGHDEDAWAKNRRCSFRVVTP